jgi:hypothetical protein
VIRADSHTNPKRKRGRDKELPLPSLALRAAVSQENEEARTEEAGFFLRHVFLRERRYADLGNLLPMLFVEPAVEPGVSALPVC